MFLFLHATMVDGTQWVLHRVTMPWENARTTCLSNGHDLVSIISSEKNEELNKWLHAELGGEEATSVWIGGRDRDENVR